MSPTNLCRCGQEPTRPGKTEGILCAKKKEEQRKQRSQARIVAGLCTRCGQEPLMSKTMGINCILKRTAGRYLDDYSKHLELINLLLQQNYCCFLCNEMLLLGKNANVGHRTAKTRALFKELTVNDFYWICDVCNRLMGEMTHDEFLVVNRALFDMHINNITPDAFVLQVRKICKHLKLR